MLGVVCVVSSMFSAHTHVIHDAEKVNNLGAGFTECVCPHSAQPNVLVRVRMRKRSRTRNMSFPNDNCVHAIVDATSERFLRTRCTRPKRSLRDRCGDYESRTFNYPNELTTLSRCWIILIARSITLPREPNAVTISAFNSVLESTHTLRTRTCVVNALTYFTGRNNQLNCTEARQNQEPHICAAVLHDRIRLCRTRCCSIDDSQKLSALFHFHAK